MDRKFKLIIKAFDKANYNQKQTMFNTLMTETNKIKEVLNYMEEFIE